MANTLIRYWGSFFKGPALARQFAAVFREAASRGWESCLVCCRPPQDPTWERPLRDIGIPIEYLARPRSNFDAACVRRVYRLCCQLRCDVLHCDNMHTTPLIGAALAGVPVRLWSKRSMQPAYEARRPLTLRDRIAISVRKSCWLATRVLAVSSAVRDELVGLGMPAHKMLVFPNPVAKPPVADRGAARVRFGYENEELVILTIGHAVPVKGWDVLLRSFARVARELPNARLLMIGSTSDSHERECYTELRSLIAQNDLTMRVHFAGHLPNIAPALAAADMFVLPSHSEGYGIALTEALASGLPCISTRVGAAADVIRPGENGLLVERGDEQGLTDAMLALGRDPIVRQKFARRAGSTQISCTPEEYAHRLVSLCESLLAHAWVHARI